MIKQYYDYDNTAHQFNNISIDHQSTIKSSIQSRTEKRFFEQHTIFTIGVLICVQCIILSVCVPACMCLCVHAHHEHVCVVFVCAFVNIKSVLVCISVCEES